MATTTSLRSGTVSVLDCRCGAGPADAPYPELHRSHSVLYVRRGSFGCRHRGRSFERVAGSVLIDPDGNNVEAVCLD